MHNTKTLYIKLFKQPRFGYSMIEPFRNADKLEFKPKFIERYSSLTDWDEFKRYNLSFLRRSIRVNTLVADIQKTVEDIRSKGWILTPVPWCKEGFWIKHPDRNDVGNLSEHCFGKIYVQEAASMIPPIVLDPQPGEWILDMCSAPGSKTTQIAAMMENTGTLVANDYRGMRAQSLGINLQRCCVVNTTVTIANGQAIKGTFDRVLCDVPCSGTGTIRKSVKTIRMWNPKTIPGIARQQLRLLRNGYKLLRPGGRVVYSTCSVEPEENEAVVSKFLAEHPEAILVNIELPGLKKSIVREFKGETYHPEIQKCARLWPQDNDTQGFFVACIDKP